MTQKQVLAMLRKLINDEQATGFTQGGNLEEPEGTQELLVYLDRAIDEYSKRQASAGDLRLIKRINVVDGMTLPYDFISFCGVVPFTVEGKAVNAFGDVAFRSVRYFSRLPYITDFDETEPLPYDYDQYMTFTALAAIYALNKHEYNVSQHLYLLGMGVSPDVAAEQPSQ